MGFLCSRLGRRSFTEIYEATLPETCGMLKSAAKSALSREKTSCNGNLVLVSEREKNKERNKEKLRGNIEKSRKIIKPRNTI